MPFAQLSQEAIAGYLLVAVTVIGGVIAIYAKLASIETEITGLRDWLRQVSNGETPAMATLDQRVTVLEHSVGHIESLILRCRSCREAAAAIAGEAEK